MVLIPLLIRFFNYELPNLLKEIRELIYNKKYRRRVSKNIEEVKEIFYEITVLIVGFILLSPIIINVLSDHIYLFNRFIEQFCKFCFYIIYFLNCKIVVFKGKKVYLIRSLKEDILLMNI